MSLQDEINKLKAEKEAIKEEFTSDLNSLSPESVKKRLLDLIPDALDQIEHLLRHAESEAIRFNASKYVLGLSTSTETTEEALSKLINDLKPPTPHATPNPKP